MKRICKRKVMIDALTLCFEAMKPQLIEDISKLKVEEYYDLCEFKLFRIEGRYFDYVYAIQIWDGERSLEFGQLKFGLNRNDDCNNHANSLQKVWIALNNEVLYSDDFHFLDYIATALGLAPHNITSLDLCLDTPFNVSQKLKQLIRDSSITTYLNGKIVKDRNEDRPEITYVYSGSLAKDKYVTVNVKQRKAIKDKNKGVTVLTYDKAAEIRNSSHKNYILDYYESPRKLFRTEVHLNNEDIKDYFAKIGESEITYWMFHSENLLEGMFFEHLNSVIKFKKGNQAIEWKHLLGRVA